jgi:hypothetical protein
MIKDFVARGLEKIALFFKIERWFLLPFSGRDASIGEREVGVGFLERGFGEVRV